MADDLQFLRRHSQSCQHRIRAADLRVRTENQRTTLPSGLARPVLGRSSPSSHLGTTACPRQYASSLSIFRKGNEPLKIRHISAKTSSSYSPEVSAHFRYLDERLMRTDAEPVPQGDCFSPVLKSNGERILGSALRDSHVTPSAAALLQEPASGAPSA